MIEKGSPGSAAFTRFAWAVVAWNLAVIFSGAYVRATGSGAGCGAHWPLCNGLATPDTSNIHTMIEYSHRALTGLDTPMVAVLVFLAFRLFPKGHAVRKAAVLSGVFLLSEALFGAVLVLSKHVVKNANPFLNSAHFLNTLTLLAMLTLTARWGSGKPATLPVGRARWAAAVSLGTVMLLAVSGDLSALGDTLFPASSLAAGIAQDFDPASSLLLRLRALHPLLAAAVAAWLSVYAAGRLRGAKGEALRVISLVWVQLLAGLLNLVLLAPVGMQLVHLLIADLLWISLVLLCAA